MKQVCGSYTFTWHFCFLFHSVFIVAAIIFKLKCIITSLSAANELVFDRKKKKKQIPTNCIRQVDFAWLLLLSFLFSCEASISCMEDDFLELIVQMSYLIPFMELVH